MALRQKPRKGKIKPYAFFQSVRNRFQLAVLIVTLFSGFWFYLYVAEIVETGTTGMAYPGGVEGFLPIGSLMSMKYWVLTGILDNTHVAGVFILLFAILTSLLLKKVFCGWFCPVGTISEWLWKAGLKWRKKNYLPPKWLDISLRSLKYILMWFFVTAVMGMDAPLLKNFLSSDYWKIADVKMLFFFTKMDMLGFGIILFLVVFSLFIRNFWCRYLCPYGALLGIFSLASPTRIERNDYNCIDCAKCAKVCPAYLPVDTKPHIMSSECTGCTTCVEVCPVKDTLDFKTLTVPDGFWTPARIAAAVGGSFVVMVIVLRIAGLWESSVTPEEVARLLPRINEIGHR